MRSSIGARLAGPERAPMTPQTCNPVSDIHARVSGVVQVNDDVVTITWSDEEHREYAIPAAAHIVVTADDTVKAGDALTAGPKNPQQILQIQGQGGCSELPHRGSPESLPLSGRNDS